VILHDARKNISGLAHFMLPEKIRKDEALGKYADTAIPVLFSRLVNRGSSRENLKAYLTGGADMFRYSTDLKIATIGQRNVEAAKRILGDLEIPIVYDDTGGEQGRTVLFDNHGGEIQVKTLEKIVWKGKGK
jgi:chemotaxis protein CheD